MKTTLHSSPFALLGVSIRDCADKIVEQAEEKSLFLDSEVCTKARSELTTVRNRLATEIRWLPGVAPNRAASLLDALENDIESLKADTSLPPLAHANILAAVFEILDPEMSTSNWQGWIMKFAYTVDSIEALDVLREINGDRTISGFAEVKSTDQIEAELEERRRYYTDTIKNALNRLDLMKLVEVVTDVVEYSTSSGDDHAPRIVHELVDRYEMETNRYLTSEAENINKLIEAIRNNSHNGEAAIRPQIDKLEEVVRKWDKIAQPIQLSMKAQGLDHQLSHDVAWGIRSLAVDLFNQHDMVSIVTRITKTLQELFAELPAVAVRLDEDVDAIGDIIKDRENAEKRIAEEAKKITFEAELGLIFKDKLRISPHGIEYKDRQIPLEEISWVRWGAVLKSSYEYTVAVGGNRVFPIVVETKRHEVYEALTNSLWKAVCVRLIEQYLQALKVGDQLSIGGVAFDDNGIILTKHKLFGNETLYKKWSEINYFSTNGSLVIQDKNDEKTYEQLSYLSVENTHILEAMIRISFKNWKGRLSGILGD